MRTETITDWRSFQQHADGLKGTWIFRGQHDAKWRLRPSLARICEDRHVDESVATSIEKEVIQRFNLCSALLVLNYLDFPPGMESGGSVE
jgi:hypothetical protein